jgi:hypothetical protein
MDDSHARTDSTQSKRSKPWLSHENMHLAALVIEFPAIDQPLVVMAKHNPFGASGQRYESRYCKRKSHDSGLSPPAGLIRHLAIHHARDEDRPRLRRTPLGRRRDNG